MHVHDAMQGYVTKYSPKLFTSVSWGTPIDTPSAYTASKRRQHTHWW